MNEGTQNGEARVESGCEKQKRGAGAKVEDIGMRTPHLVDITAGLVGRSDKRSALRPAREASASRDAHVRICLRSSTRLGMRKPILRR